MMLLSGCVENKVTVRQADNAVKIASGQTVIVDDDTFIYGLSRPAMGDLLECCNSCRDK